jgi:poly(A) polymerase
MAHCGNSENWSRCVIEDAQTVTRENRRSSDSIEPDESEGHAPSHRLSLRDVDADALKVVRKLHAAGHEAYLVGGCVRDLYLNRKPKDFDVATSARPEQIRRVFRNSRIIGRRFKLAHVFFGSKVIETSTFRAPIAAAISDPSDEEAGGEDEDQDLLITHDNEWGDVEQDARRRDFTINGLFFDIEHGQIVDFVDGVDDLDRGVIRTIGDPLVRFREDPVRMIRAIKFAARLDFMIDDASWSALLECAPDIARCSRARLVEEIYKLLRGGACKRAFELMLEADLFQYIWPDYIELYDEVGGLHRPGKGDPDEPADLPSALFWRYLAALDDYVMETGQTPSNGVIQAILFAPLLDKQLLDVSRAELDVYIDDLMTPPCAALGVARRDRELARQIFMAHRRMMQPSPKRGGKSSLVQRQYFHDALLFLGFSVEARDNDGGVLEHWRLLASGQLVTGARAAGADGERPGGTGKRRRSRGRRGKRKPRREGDGPAGARAGES